MGQQTATGLREASWEDVVRAVAKQHGVNPVLALAVARKESSLRPDAVGDGGKAIGLFQLHDAAARDAGITDRNDPIQNITGGVKYLKQLSDRYQGDVNKTLLAYNGGLGNVDAGTVSPAAQAYASSVLADISRMTRETAAAATGVPAAAAGRPVQPGAGPGGRAGGAGPVAAPGGRAGGAGPGPAGPMDTSLPTPSSLLAPWDPRTHEGRQNLAATAGDVVGAVVTRGLPVGTITAKVAQVLTPAVLAGTFAAGERAVEERIGAQEPGGVAAAGATQTGYSLGGQALMWPVRALFKSLIAPKVATTASATLSGRVQAAKDTGVALVEQVRNDVQLATQMVRDAWSAAKRTVAADARGATQAAKRTTAERLAQIEAENAASVAAVTKQYDNLLGEAPSVLAGGRAVQQTLQGPTKRALDLAGQRVAEAAADGPEIPLQPIREALEDIAGQYRPTVLFPTAAHEAVGAAVNIGARPVGTPAGNRISREQYQQLIANLSKKLDLPESHPLPGLLGKIQAIDPSVSTLSFAEAHQLKMLLDEAVNWDRVAKRHVEKITKGLRTTLREQMMGHAPYDEATAAYQAIVPIYRKGVGKRMLQLAATPDGTAKLARMLEKSDAAQARVLRQLLVDQAAAGGDALSGQRAWDAVRSAYTFDKVIAGGIDNLGTRIEKLLTTQPEFVRTVYGDASGQQVLKNLATLAETYQTVNKEFTERLATAKASGAAGLEEVADVGRFATDTVKDQAQAAILKAQQTGQSRVAAAKNVAQAGVTAAAKKKAEFAKTKLGKTFVNRTLLDEGADMARFAALGWSSYWGALSGLRLLFKSPRAAELVEWAAYSPQNTQRIVNFMLKPGTPEATAALLRELGGVLGATPMPSHAPSAPAPEP